MTGAHVSVPDVHSGVAHWWRSYRMMTRWELTGMRSLLPLIVMVQVLIGAGFALGIGLFFVEIPQRNALYLSTGAAVVTLVTVGLVLGPQLVAEHKVRGTADFLWSLPVPRTTQAAAWVTMNSIIAVPGMIAALMIADWRYDLPLHVTPSIVPAVLLTIVSATMIGYAFAHAIRLPMVIHMITQLVSFGILGFAPINIPPENLPGWLVEVNHGLPFEHMAIVMRAGLTDGLVSHVAASYLVVIAYAIVAVAVAAWVVGRRD